uniref:Uncharacterized protein n=1 Tax=Setaria italica TaxID=4555 RepID=K3XT48_SETIT
HTGSPIAFSCIAEDLVKSSASEASQNMKIDFTAEPAVSMETAIGKIRLLHMMSTDSPSNFSTKYVSRKSFPLDSTTSTLLQREACISKRIQTALTPGIPLYPHVSL